MGWGLENQPLTFFGAGAITNNGSLVFNRTGTVTVAVEVSGTGTLEQAGSGTTVLGGVNTFTGATTVTGNTTLLFGLLGGLGPAVTD